MKLKILTLFALSLFLGPKAFSVQCDKFPAATCPGWLGCRVAGNSANNINNAKCVNGAGKVKGKGEIETCSRDDYQKQIDDQRRAWNISVDKKIYITSIRWTPPCKMELSDTPPPEPPQEIPAGDYWTCYIGWKNQPADHFPRSEIKGKPSEGKCPEGGKVVQLKNFFDKNKHCGNAQRIKLEEFWKSVCQASYSDNSSKYTACVSDNIDWADLKSYHSSQKGCLMGSPSSEIRNLKDIGFVVADPNAKN